MMAARHPRNPRANRNQLSLARLNSLSSNKRELEAFLQTDVGNKFSLMIRQAVDNYSTMMKELQYMEENLPELLDDLKTIQQKVDKRHKRSNAATAGGCATSLVGGAMIVGGIVAAPFTLGASIGLTAAGTVVTAAGSVTTATAKGYDHVKGKANLTQTNKMVQDFQGHYKAAQEAYEAVHQICQDLTTMLPALENEGAKGITSALNAVVCATGFAVKAATVSKSQVNAGLTICKAVISPGELHAATRLALAPTKTAPLTRQFLSGALDVAKCATRFDSGGLKLAVMTSFRTAGVMIKTAGGVLAIGGIILDAYSLISTGKDLYKGKKCEVSQEISKHIENLENLSYKLENLNRELSANVRSMAISN